MPEDELQTPPPAAAADPAPTPEPVQTTPEPIDLGSQTAMRSRADEPLDLGSQIAAKGGLPKDVQERINKIEKGG